MACVALNLLLTAAWGWFSILIYDRQARAATAGGPCSWTVRPFEAAI